jgi:hypothetical protein
MDTFVLAFVAQDAVALSLVYGCKLQLGVAATASLLFGPVVIILTWSSLVILYGLTRKLILPRKQGSVARKTIEEQDQQRLQRQSESSKCLQARFGVAQSEDVLGVEAFQTGGALFSHHKVVA